MNKLTLKFFTFIMLVLAVIGIILIFTVDQRTWVYLKSVRFSYLFLALLALAIGWVYDAYRIIILARATGKHLTWSSAWQIIFSNYFLGVLTPAAVGGLLAQIYFLKKAGISGGNSTAIVLIRTALSLVFLISFFPLMIINTSFSPIALLDTSSLLLVFSILLVIAIIYLLLYPGLFKKIFVLFSSSPLVGFYLKKKSWWLRLENCLNDLVVALGHFKGNNRKSLLLAFVYTGTSLFFLFLSVPLIIYSFNFFPNLLEVLGRVALLNFFLYFAPIPGGIGVAEGGMIFLLKDLVPLNTLGLVAIFWRCLAEYLPFLIGLLICLRSIGLQKLNDLPRKE